MKKKLKDFYHKYDYKINANFILETIIEFILSIIIFMLIFLLGHKEVKAENIPAPSSFTNYCSSGVSCSSSSFNWNVGLKPNWWWGHELYTPLLKNSDSPVEFNLYSTNRLDFVWSNFRKYCGDKVNVQGSFTFGENFNAVADTFSVYIYNGNNVNSCTYSVDYSTHKLNFNCSTNLDYDSMAIGLKYNSINGLYSYIGLLSSSQYSCDIDSSAIINNQNQNTQSIINNNNSNTNNIINNYNQNTDKLIDSIQGDDINTDDIPVREDDTLNEYNNAEDSLLSDDLDIKNTIKIDSNKNAMNFVWELITKILNWNDKLFTFIISALSIGFIKLVLCR